jgi:rod shape-determining protein MreD
MDWLRNLAPIGSIAFLTVLAVLPWGLPSEYRFFLPLLPVIAIHFWTLRHDAWIPEWLVFLAGLTIDILTLGPLGYWALIYLVAHLVATFSTPYSGGGSLFRLALLAVALLAVAVTAWAVASLYFFSFADWRPYAKGATLAAIAAIVIVPILHALDAPEPGGAHARFNRGG